MRRLQAAGVVLRLRVDALRLRRRRCGRRGRSLRRGWWFRLGRGAGEVVPPAVAVGGDRRRGVSGWKRAALTALDWLHVDLVPQNLLGIWILDSIRESGDWIAAGIETGFDSSIWVLFCVTA